VIRTATAADVPAILELIRELATYEREPLTSVENTPDALHETLFGPDPAVWALVAEHEGTVVGTAIWFRTYSTWTGRPGMHLEDIVVSASARGGGHGVALFEELLRICRERGYGRFEWRALDWNVDAARFYRARGAQPLPEWVSWRLTP
jgi:GNAT superfamily N-acetyltransferase